MPSSSKTPTKIMLPRGEACSNCRVRKRRCDGAKPVCDNCSRLRKECVYDPSIELVHGLEARIQELETQISEESASSSRSSRRRLSVSASSSATSPTTSSDDLLMLIKPSHPAAYFDTATLLRALSMWDINTSMPTSLRLHLADIFISYQALFGFQLYPPRLRERMGKETPQDNGAFHPALINAISLIACSCGGPEMQWFEELFLMRSRQGCADALGLVQGVEDFVIASALQTTYLAKVGRMQEAYQVSSTVSHFALSLQLQNQCNPHSTGLEPWTMIGSPTDDIHFAERICTWWSIYFMSRTLSHIMALPGGFPVLLYLDITTTYPGTFEDVEAAGIGSWPQYSVHSALDTSTRVCEVQNDTPLALLAKGQCLVTAASICISYFQGSQDLEVLGRSYHELVHHASRFRSTLPPVHTRSKSNAVLSYHNFPSAADPILVEVFVMGACASLLLSSAAIPLTAQAYTEGLNAAHSVADMVTQVDQPCIKFLNAMILVPRFRIFTNLLVREVDRIRSSSSQDLVYALKSTQRSLRRILDFLGRVRVSSPALDDYVFELNKQLSGYVE